MLFVTGDVEVAMLLVPETGRLDTGALDALERVADHIAERLPDLADTR